MKGIFWLIIAIAGLFITCKPDNELDVRDTLIQNVPDSVLSVENMILVMTDIHLAESWSFINKGDTISQDQQLRSYYSEVFQMHDTDQKKFQASYNYYANEPLLMNYIYQKITERLNILESENLNIQKQSTNEKSN